ncbi:MAG: peptidoglycan editing factor PgeF [Proteobacteria bacterium]|nr:peptidoglycan editing factor PgeF [Sideroxydans sp.]MBU4152316.1 peptidoglycan editing factor PgeF [Pseudomonadota bacterium]
MLDNHLPKLLPYVPFSSWNRVAGGFFSRHGGRSRTPFAALNVSYGVGDDPSQVDSNRKLIKEALGLNCLVSARQVHGDEIAVIDTPVADDHEHSGFDALITNQPGVGIMIQQADCQAVVLYDSKKRVVANVHAGWRGSVANIVAKTIEEMNSQFGCEPSQIKAAISPSLGPCCAEFVNFAVELPESFHQFQITPNYFDFWAITRSQLQDAGVIPGNIQAAGVCTRCDHNYFSYRRTPSTGRCATVAALG